MMISRPTLVCTFMLTALTLLNLLCMANAGQGKHVYMDEVVVTARKTPETAEDIPLCTSVYSLDHLEEARTDSVGDVARMTPNFDFHSSGSRRTPLFLYLGDGIFRPQSAGRGRFS